MLDKAEDIHPLFNGAPKSTEFKKLRKRIVSQTREAIEQFGMQHFRVSPMAFLVDSLKRAAKGVRTPPDWWQEAKRKEQRIQQPTKAGNQVMSKLLDEVFGSDRSASSSPDKPERAGDLLKGIC